MFNFSEKISKSTSPFKAMAAAAGIAVLLGACSTQTPVAAPPTTEAPTVTVAVDPPVTVAPPVTVVDPPTTQAPKPAVPDYTVGVCGSGNISDGLEYQVINIKDNDPDGGLVLRQAPSYNQPRITTISEYSVVWSYGTSDSCAIDSKGRTWWYIDAPGVASGWVNSYYLGIYNFDTSDGVVVDHGGEIWVDDAYLDMEYACLNGVTDCTEFYATYGSGD